MQKRRGKILMLHTKNIQDHLPLKTNKRNIEEAIRWTTERRRRFTFSEILTEDFVRELHQKMLGEVWEWAGTL